MASPTTFPEFSERLRVFIRSAAGSPEAESTAEFNQLALALFRLQLEFNPAYAQLCQRRRVSADSVVRWPEIPAVPTAAFKEVEMTSLSADERTATFVSSGTTAEQRSRHFHSAESLQVYEASLLASFDRHLLADLDELVTEELIGPTDKLPFLILTPTPTAAPNSSLVHMFETARHAFGSRDSLFLGDADASGGWTLDIERALFAIRKSMCANRPVVLLGAAFSFVHLLDYFIANNMRYRLARGSRVLETGGYKGRSREIPRRELHGLIAKHLGIAESHIVTEFGMSELSSQAYDNIVVTTRQTDARNISAAQNPRSPLPAVAPSPEAPVSGERIFHFPPWARAQVISPETGREVPDGETGLLRVFDLANVRSVMAIQTEDLAVRRDDGFELAGRAPGAAVRGCSLMPIELTR